MATEIHINHERYEFFFQFLSKQNACLIMTKFV